MPNQTKPRLRHTEEVRTDSGTGYPKPPNLQILYSLPQMASHIYPEQGQDSVERLQRHPMFLPSHTMS